MLAGPNGAGKTTAAPVLLPDLFGIVEFVNADLIAAPLRSIQADNVAVHAGRILVRRLERLAAERQSFAFESTLAARSHTRHLIEWRRQGFSIQLIFLYLRSAELAVQRVHTRVLMGGHDVPDIDVTRRYTGGLRNFFRLYRPLADRWRVYDVSDAYGIKPVAEGDAERILQVHDTEVWEAMRRKAGDEVLQET